MTDDVPPPTSATIAHDLPTAELISRATQQLSTLVRDELALARIELAHKGKRMGVGAGLFGGAGALSGYGIGLLIVAAVLGLAIVWPAWLAALAVGVGVLAIAGVLTLAGRRQIAGALPPVPTEAAHSVASDVETVGAAIRDGRHS
jgi:hypothetical protein